MIFFQFGAETQQSKVAPSSAAARPIQSSREQVWRSRESWSSKAALQGSHSSPPPLWFCNINKNNDFEALPPTSIMQT